MGVNSSEMEFFLDRPICVEFISSVKGLIFCVVALEKVALMVFYRERS